MTDYNKIKKSIAGKFRATGIVCTTGQAQLIDWNKIKAYGIDATFSKGSHQLTMPYRRGLGLFDEKDILEPWQQGGRQKLLLSNKVTRRYFKPSEIFACACWEAVDAIVMTAEDYCAELFGNADSYKGHQAHAACIRQYALIANLIGREELEEFANLYGEL